MFQDRNTKILLNLAKRRNRDSRNISIPCFFFSKRTVGMLKNNDQLSLTLLTPFLMLELLLLFGQKAGTRLVKMRIANEKLATIFQTEASKTSAKQKRQFLQYNQDDYCLSCSHMTSYIFLNGCFRISALNYMYYIKIFYISLFLV